MDNCPHCNVSLIGGPIPEHLKEYSYGTHWRREIGVEIQGEYDGTLYYMCPDCKGTWDRFPWQKGKYTKKGEVSKQLSKR